MTAEPALRKGKRSCSRETAVPGTTRRRSVGAIARFLEHCRVGKCLSPHTLRAYGGDLTDFAAHIGRIRVTDVDRESIREYTRTLLDQRNLKSTTVRRRIATLKVLYRWMEREELVPISVFHRLDLSIRLPRRLPRSLKSNEMRLLLHVADQVVRRSPASGRYDARLMQFAVVALFTTGLRIGELVTVCLGDVSAQDGSIQVRGKGNRERRVYMPGTQALSALRRFLDARTVVGAGCDRLLVTEGGNPVSSQHVRTRLRSLGEKAGIDRRVTPHMLRHTAATQLLEAGVDIRFVQTLLGHTSIATTQIYTTVRDAALKESLSKANTLQRLSRAL